MVALIEVKNFGGIDADADALLEACFEDHEAYLAARNHERFLITGRKGSGKTAIFKKFLRSQSHDFFSFGHTFSDYPWQHHDRQKKIGVPEEQCYLHSWEYLILLTLSKILLNYDQSQPWSEAATENMSRLENFVIDTYGSRDPDVSQIFLPTTKIHITPHFDLDLGLLKAGLSAEQLPMAELPTIIQEVNANLAFAVTNSLNPGMNYYVCFDELDLGFSVTDKNYRLRLIGLLLAARKINVAARENEKKLSVLVFLRDDIYNSLQFEDKNKITENASSRIEWDTGHTDRTLKELMERRFSEVLEIPRETAWDAVFDETKEMPGHQKKYQHILDRTFLRPRDIIKSCNEILSVYKARGHEAGDKFQNRDVIDSRAAYSEYLLKELDDEIHKHIPEYKNYIEVIKTLDSLQFEFQDFDSACKQRTGILPPDYDPRQILSQLFEFSILGYYKAGGGGYGGAEYVWRYQDPNARFNENAANFRIHPGFKEVLGLKKYTKSG